ncbi:MAG: type II secretion system protein J [Candidatus Saccharibacteria bacterium]
MAETSIKYNFKDNSGLTILELVVAMFILSLVLGGIYQFYDFAQRSSAEAQAQAIVQQQVSLFTSGLRREVIGATEAVLNEKSVVVDSNKKQVNIYTDIDWDGRPELVQYEVNANAMKRRVIEFATYNAPYYTYSYSTTNPPWTTVVDRVKKLKDPHPNEFFYAGKGDNGKKSISLRAEMEADNPDYRLRDPIEIKMTVLTRQLNQFN